MLELTITLPEIRSVATLCMLYSQDHTKHPIISRQIVTFLSTGHTIIVLDSPGGKNDQPIAGYVRVTVRTFELRLCRTWIWKFVRPFALGRLNEIYWTTLVCSERLLTAMRYAKAAYGCKADIYQAHDLWALIPALMAGKFHKRSVLYDAHEMASDQGDPSSLYNCVLRWMERCLLPQVDHVILPNRSRAEVYMARHHLKSEPLVVLNCPPMMQVERTNLLRQKLNLSPSTKIVLYHGALMPGRALEELLRSAYYLEQGIVLVIIGEQNIYYEQILRPLWNSERLQGKVFFLPYIPQPDVFNYVASADLGVVIYENINRNNFLCAPTKLYEYIMLNVPVIACDFPEISEFLKQYPVGFTFNPTDSLSIATAINRFFAIEKEQRSKINFHLKSARRLFNWDSESQKLLNLVNAISAAC